MLPRENTNKSSNQGCTDRLKFYSISPVKIGKYHFHKSSVQYLILSPVTMFRRDTVPPFNSSTAIAGSPEDIV